MSLSADSKRYSRRYQDQFCIVNVDGHEVRKLPGAIRTDTTIQPQATLLS